VTGSVTGKLGVMLAGGGARAAYQVGVLHRIGERRPELPIPIITGVSAGAINAGFLAAHRGNLADATDSLRRKWCSLTTEEVFRSDPASLARIGLRWAARLLSGGARFAPAAHGMIDTAPLRGFLVRNVDPRGIEENIQEGRLLALALSALSYQTGRTVTFVQGNAPIRLNPDSVHHRAVRAKITVEHIMASAAIPILFPAIKVGQQYYGDGSFRYAAPLSPAIQLGADRILAVSARYARRDREVRRPEVLGYPPPARILELLLNSAFLDTLDWDVARLKRINLLLERLTPEERRMERLRKIGLLVIRPSEDIGRIASEYEVRLPLLLRYLVRGLGTPETRNADLLSYLLFESAYLSRLIELGEKDADRNWPRIHRFLDAGTE